MTWYAITATAAKELLELNPADEKARRKGKASRESHGDASRQQRRCSRRVNKAHEIILLWIMTLSRRDAQSLVELLHHCKALALRFKLAKSARGLQLKTFTRMVVSTTIE